jgi:hypothetical protein
MVKMGKRVNQSIGSDQKGSGKFNGHKESRIVQLDTGRKHLRVVVFRNCDMAQVVNMQFRGTLLPGTNLHHQYGIAL